MVARAGKGWKLAAALITMEDQVNAKYPKRSKASDGSIGDLAHMVRTSDHNVRNGYCHALDLTNDPLNGFSSEKFAQTLLDAQDPRLSYVISNKKIGSGPKGPSPGMWRPYNGANPHDHHCHISTNSLGETDSRVWNIGDKPVKPQPQAKPALPVLRNGSVGVDVQRLQRTLGIRADAIFGRETERMVKLFQAEHGLTPDGIVGPQTWKALNA